ncbi:MAG: TlpA family protein disulfide reductase [Burkholderiales bacterium]
MAYGWVGQAAPRNRGIVGQQAPELEVDSWIDPDGRPGSFRLADHRGKWIFLKCFQNWCPGCHSHGFPALQKVASAFAGDTGVAVAGIQTVFEGFHTNTREAVRRLQLRYRLRIPMGHAPGDRAGDHLPRLMRQYRTGGTPWIIIIDRGGKVAYDGFSVNPEAVIRHFRSA